MQSNDTRSELLKWEKDFAKAVVSNDADAIGKFLANDWVIVDPNGDVIDKRRFLSVIKSGMLSHESMQSDNLEIRAYGDCAVVTALTKTKAKFGEQEFMNSGTSDGCFCEASRPLAVRVFAIHQI